MPEDRRVWLQATAAARAGHEVTVVCPAIRDHQPGTRLVEGITVVYVKGYEGQGPAGVIAEAALGAYRATRAVHHLGLRRGDLLQVCTPPDSLPLLLRWARRRGVATVYDQHDVVPLLAATKRSQRRLVPVHRRLERATVRASSVVITAGSAQAARLKDLYGVEAVVVRTAAGDTELRHEPTSSPSVLGYLGVMGSQDGVDGLIRALRLLHDRGRTDVTLRLAGDGPEAARLRNLIVELRLESSVEMAGWLPAERLSEFLSTIDALVVPDPVSAFNHTCPMLKVSHALAQGLPVVMTPLEENLAITLSTRFVARGHTPADLADAVEELLSSPSEERLAEGSRLRRRYDEVLAWGRHERRYNQVLADAQPMSRS